MMISRATERERRKIREVAREYENEGYDVKIDPRPEELPEFLEPYSPDIVASRGGQWVLIEVKSRESLPSSDYMPELAEVIREHPKWRYEFVLTNPKRVEEIPTEKRLINLDEMDDRYMSVRSLVDSRDYDASLLLLWSLLEATLRHLARNEEVELESRNPRYLIKYLVSLGLIDQTSQRQLNRALDQRNEVVHGFRADGVDKRYIQQVTRLYLKLTEALLTSIPGK